MISEVIEQETSVTDRKTLELDASVAESSVVGDSLKESAFSNFFESTRAHDHGALEPELIGTSTPLVGESPERRAPRWRVVGSDKDIELPEREQRVQLDQFAKEDGARVALLARKYVDKENFSKENMARLAIVTERVRRLLPAITVTDVEKLEGFVLKINRAADTDKRLRARLGLRPPKYG